MVFSSAIFLTIYLPLFLILYYTVFKNQRSLLILLASYIFYGFWRIDFLMLFIGATVFNYFVSIPIQKAGAGTAKARKWVAIGVTGDLLLLGYFKYFNFGVDSFNALIVSMGGQPWDAWSVILPIGISFYIFHCISYLVDIYRGDAELLPKFRDFAAFVALFPQLVAGPVLRYKDIAYQFAQRTHTWAKFNEGVMYFCAGFCKKVLIADTLAPLADMMFAKSDPTFFEAWLGVLAYAAQLFFDFCGYSQMAIGLGLMIGFRFIENFDHPYISRSITEFWRRWHISLSTWLRDYLYIPLGGNRKGKVRTYINLLLTMVLGGLWHGANWTFVIWGTLHGAVLALERAIGSKGKDTPYPVLLAWPITFFIVMIGWTFFRAPDVGVAMDMLSGMFGQQGYAITDAMAWQITPLMLGTLVIAYLLCFISPHYVRMKSHYEAGWAVAMPVWQQMGMLILFITAVAKLIAQSHSPFLYFQF